MMYQGKYETTDLLADVKRKMFQEFSSMLRGYLCIIPCTSSSSGRTWHPDVKVAVRYCISNGKQPSRHCPPAWALGKGQTPLGVKEQHIMKCYTGHRLGWMIAKTNSIKIGCEIWTLEYLESP